MEFVLIRAIHMINFVLCLTNCERDSLKSSGFHAEIKGKIPTFTGDTKEINTQSADTFYLRFSSYFINKLS